jgi:hypothetical protein
MQPAFMPAILCSPRVRFSTPTKERCHVSPKIYASHDRYGRTCCRERRLRPQSSARTAEPQHAEDCGYASSVPCARTLNDNSVSISGMSSRMCSPLIADGYEDGRYSVFPAVTAAPLVFRLDVVPSRHPRTAT